MLHNYVASFPTRQLILLNEELVYKRGVAQPNNMWLNVVKMAGRLSVAPSLLWLLSIIKWAVGEFNN